MSDHLETENHRLQHLKSGPHGLLVLIHGFLDKPQTWNALIDKLDLPDWSIVAVDLESLHDTTNGDGNILERLADALASDIRALDVPRAAPRVIVGHSMGGQIAELLAMKLEAVDGLVLIVPAPLAGYPLSDVQRKIFEATAVQKDPSIIAQGRRARVEHVTDEGLHVLASTAAATSVDFSLASLDAWTIGHPTGNQKSGLDIPVLLITTGDKFFTRDFLEKNVLSRFINGAIGVVEGAGHWPHVERPPELAAELTVFISSVAAQSKARLTGQKINKTNEQVEAELTRWFFGDYLGMWVDIGKGKAEPSAVLSYWGAPLHAAAVVQTRWLKDSDEVLLHVAKTQKPLKEQNYDHTIVLDHRVTVYNASAASIDAIWSRRRIDESQIERVASHFEIHMTENGWRVVAMANRPTESGSLAEVWAIEETRSFGRVTFTFMSRSSTMPEFVSFSRAGDVGYITLHRPPQNRANRQLVADLGQAVDEAALSDVRAVVIKAEGSDFCMGGDFREWPTYSSYQKRKERWTFSNGILSKLENLPVPTISAVQGRAFGFGFELALHTDLIVASEDAVFRFPEATIAVFPLAGGAQRVAERAGRSVAVRLVMLSEEITSTAAKSYNIITHHVQHAELETTATQIAEKLAAGPTRAHAATKAVLSAWGNSGIAAADATMIENIPNVLATDDVADAIQAAAEALNAGKDRPSLRFRGE